MMKDQDYLFRPLSSVIRLIFVPVLRLRSSVDFSPSSVPRHPSYL
jgi:hypothetical protein